MVKSNIRALKVFISYSSRDLEYLNELLPHVTTLESVGRIELYYDGRIKPGEAWAEMLNKFIREADIIIFLVSAEALASSFVNKEIEIAYAQYKSGNSKIIPVLLQPCNWNDSVLSELTFIPDKGRPLNSLDEKERLSVFYQLTDIINKIAEDAGNNWEIIIDKELKEHTGTLNLSNFGLTGIPSVIAKMDWLHSMILTNNQISDISLLKALPKLESLYLSSNQIRDIDVLGLFAGLKFLDLNNNAVADISPIKDLRLSYLYLHQNNIESIADLSALSETLLELDLSTNRISKIEGLEKLKHLSILNLSENKITKITGLTGLKELKELMLVQNLVEKIEGLETLENLELFDVFRNKISVIEGLDKNIHLKTLGLSSNSITELTNIDHLTELKTIYLAHNQIEDITELQVLTNLTRAVLTNNKITDLFSIKTFIENNIPVKNEYSFNPAETGFFVKDNPVQYPPMEVLLQGKDAILRSFTQVQKGLDEKLESYQSNEIKIILVGNANVGKTHIAHYIKTNKQGLPANNASTHGMANSFVQYYPASSATPIKMRILDFGGQEYYHDTHHLFFTLDTIYLLLWEKNSNRFGLKTEKRFSTITGNDQDETNAVFPVAYWLDAINYFINKSNNEKKSASLNIIADSNVAVPKTGIDPVVILVETKRDKKGSYLLDTSSILSFNNLIHSQSAIALYKDNATNTVINTGTASLFDSLDNLVSTMNEKRWSGYYKLVVDFFESIDTPANTSILESLKADGLILELGDCIKLFNKIVNKAGYKYKFDNANAEDLCRFLANRGYIIYYNNSKICLYPNKLTEDIYTVLKKEYKRVGMISREEADPENADVLSIMEKFKLLIPHPGGNGYVAPQLLPENANADLMLFMEVFKPPVIRFSFTGYIHKNIVQELFYAFKTELIQDNTQNYIWKNGFVIKLDNELYKINISSNENSRVIEIQYLNTLNMLSLNKVSDTISTALDGRACSKEVSNDGKLFIPVKLIEQNALLAQFVFNEQMIRVADYKNFLGTETRKYAMKKLFISYSSKNTEFMKRFVTHLEPLKRRGDIDYWHDRKIEPGTKWDDSIKKEMELSDMVIFLLSPDFIATDYIFDVEIPQALKQFTTQSSKLFFIELQPCSWDKTILADYQQATDPTADNKKLLTIAQPSNDTQWTAVVDLLLKKLG